MMAVQEVAPFGNMVRRYRRALELTQEELAERAGLSERAVREIEHGTKHLPRKETVRLLADALELGRAEREAFESATRRGGGPKALGRGIPSSARTNLPDEPTPFIGREREIAQVVHLLQQPHVRLVTLTGMGGTGKTRLALQVAGHVLTQFEDGIFMVSLAPVSTPDLVLSTMAGAMGVKEPEGSSLLDAVKAHLESKHLLLVLDNFEHLLDAAPQVGELLDACRELHILVTSPIPLQLSREHQYAVPPLSVPDPTHLPPFEQLCQYEAVAFFIDRAQAVKADFVLMNETAAAVAEICQRLDGLPLAIELAAARIKVLPPQALLQRLSSRLALLTGGARDRPARHQTLRAAIDWSYSLLSEGERELFARLSLFAGSFTLEAAEAVCDAQGDLTLAVPDGVASLVEKSLLQRAGEAQSRFNMLETVREYAAERLEASGVATVLRRQHARSYLLLAETAAPQLHGPRQVEWLAQLAQERDNLRAALHWSAQSQELELGLRLAVGLRQFWLTRGYQSEGQRWLEGLLEREKSTGAVISQATHARALHALATVACWSNESASVEAWLKESLCLSRGLGDGASTAEALVSLASAVFCRQGDLKQVGELSEESLSLGRELDDRRIIALSLYNLAMVAWAEYDLVRQRDLLEQSLRLLREVGDLGGMIAPLQIAGWGAFTRGDFERAAGHFAEQRALCQELGDQPGIVTALFGLGTVARERGDYGRARELFAEGMDVAQQADDPDARATALLGLGELALDLSDVERTTAFCMESLAIFRSIEETIMIASSLHTLVLQR